MSPYKWWFPRSASRTMSLACFCISQNNIQSTVCEARHEKQKPAKVAVWVLINNNLLVLEKKHSCSARIAEFIIINYFWGHFQENFKVTKWAWPSAGQRHKRKSQKLDQSLALPQQCSTREWRATVNGNQRQNKGLSFVQMRHNFPCKEQNSARAVMLLVFKTKLPWPH